MNKGANIEPMQTEHSKDLVKQLYLQYAQKLLSYTKRTYNLNEDDAMSVVYKTIYRVAEVSPNYTFDNEFKRQGFIFRTHINYLRNFFRDTKTFEQKHREIEITDIAEKNAEHAVNPKLNILQKLLDEMEDWQRMLLLLRGQEMPYSEIAVFVKKPEKQLKVYYARLKRQLLLDINKELAKTKNGK